MKKQLLLIVLTLTYAFCATAGAAPAVTDGETTGWIADNNYLFLQSPDGSIAQLPMAMDDLLQITDEEVICLAKDQRIIAVKNDGSGSRVIENTDAASLQDQRLKLENGILFLNDKQVSSTACAAVTDGVYLYVVEKTAQSYVLRVSQVQESGKMVAQGSRDAYALALTNKAVAEPLSLTVTKEALTLTGTDHQVTVMNLLNGEITRYPASGELTEAACMMNNVLYRYMLSDDHHWMLESGTAVVTATPVPTQTPTPTPTPKPAPTPTPYNGGGETDDDGTIYFGASGRTVRKIQDRLDELGYPVGDIDGQYGEETQLAFDLFCDAIHVREHRYITKKVQKRLFAKDAPPYDPYMPLKKGDQGRCVIYMQRRLRELGYNPGKIDGIYGKNTVQAVAAFQKDNNIKRKKKEKPGEVASSEMLEILYGPEAVPFSLNETTTPPATNTSTPKPQPATKTDL